MEQGFSNHGPVDNSSFYHIHRLGLSKEIRGLSEYRQAIGIGLSEARANYANMRLLSDPSLEKIQGIHRTIFGKAYPSWAGKFRRVGEVVKIAGFKGADSIRIEPELQVTFMQTKWILGQELRDEDLNEDLAPAAAIAQFHLRFERIHPFRDGNGRAGRVILTCQAKEAFNFDLELTDRIDYILAIREADEGELRGLVNLIRGSKAPTKLSIPTPFNIEPLTKDDLVCTSDIEYQFEASFRTFLQ